MVSSDLPPPGGPYDPYETRCKMCNTPSAFERRFGRNATKGELVWCENCRGFQPAYLGKQRPTLCESCFNRVGWAGMAPLCGAMMYQMPDGTWRDRHNQATTTNYGRGAEPITKPVAPIKMVAPQYVCDSYEDLEGSSRELIRNFNPESFYSRKRFW